MPYRIPPAFPKPFVPSDFVQPPTLPFPRHYDVQPRRHNAFLQFRPILDGALSEYKEKTGNDLLNNWLAKEIQSCDTVDEVLGIIQDEANAFDKWIGPSLRVAYKISSILGSDAVSVRIIYDDLKRL
jgi:hypothetical protein